MDDVFKALADENRRILLDLLFEQSGQTLAELTKALDISRQAVSKHLIVLEAANLVSTKWRGREKLHYLNPMPIAEIIPRWIGRFEDARLAMLLDLKSESETKEENRRGV